MKNTETVDIKNRRIGLFSRLLILLVLSALMVSTFLFISWLYKPDNFSFKKVELVNKLENQESRELQEIVAEVLNGGFFSLDVDQFRHDLLVKLPWVKNVSVRKIWPDKLLVKIEEYKPIVRWQFVDKRLHNKTQLLSQEGVIFSPKLTSQQKKKFAQLAIFSGPELSADQVLKKCFAMNHNLKKLALTIKHCGMNKRRTWFLALTSVDAEKMSDMDVKLGKDDVMQQLEQFIQVFSGKLQLYLDSIETVDLRYANGFSIKWNVDSSNKNVDLNTTL